MFATWESPNAANSLLDDTQCCICMAESPSDAVYSVGIEIDGSRESWAICEGCKDDFGDDADGAWLKAYIRTEERQRPIKAEWLKAFPALRTQYWETREALRAYIRRQLAE